MEQFAKIGKSILNRAVGLQTNYRIDERSVVIPDSCHECPFYKTMQALKDFPDNPQYKKAESICKTCPNHSKVHIYETKKYINEKNMYGDGMRLKRNALLLLLSYYLSHPNSYGVVQNCSISFYAKLLGCSYNTICAANKTLETYHYIQTSNSSYGEYSVLLCEYNNMFLPAKKGGHGYYTLSNELFSELLKIKNLNSIRIALKTILEVDNPDINSNSITKRVSEISRYLPSYCRPGVIKKAIQSIVMIFNITTSAKKVSFTLKEGLSGKNIYNKLYAASNTLIQNTLEQLETDIAKYKENTSLYDIVCFRSLHITKTTPFKLKNTAIDNLARLCIEYTSDLVIQALAYIFEDKCNYNINIKSIGALARSKIQFLIDQ